MKTRILASLILASFAGSALAVPGDDQAPLIEAQQQRKAPLLDVSSRTPQPFAIPATHADTPLAKDHSHDKRKQRS